MLLAAPNRPLWSLLRGGYGPCRGSWTAGPAFVTATRSRYPRHVAFLDELDRATAASPLLSAPPSRRR